MKSPLALIAAALMLLTSPAIAADLKFPQLTGPVVDTVDEIPADQEARIDAKIRAFKEATGHQLQVLTIPDTQNRPIAQYGVELIRAWGIGKAGVNDGVILIHALESSDGRIRIETGYGSEPVITDAASGKIIRNTIVPAFRRKAFGDGLEQGIDGIIRVFDDAKKKEEQSGAEERSEREQATLTTQAAWKGFMTFLGWTAGILAAAVGTFGIWFAATAGQRRKLREEKALRDIARARDRAAAEEARAKAEIEAAQRRMKEERRLAEERAAMLAAMTPDDRERFLADERAKAEAERAERARLAAIQAQKDEEERIARKKRREREEREEEERNRSSSTYGGGLIGGSTSDFGGGGGGGGSDWGGGGGSGGGGGATGDY